MIEPTVGSQANFLLDASIFDNQEAAEIYKDDIKLNRIEYLFPAGLNQVDLFDECRALTKLDDFEVMYDLTMSMLHGKPVTILIKNDDGTKTVLSTFQVTDRYMDLRGVHVINAYPCLVTWLVQFIGALISKKYPVPGKIQSQPQAQEKKSDKKKGKAKAHKTDT